MLELLRWGLEKPAILADPTEMPTEVTQLLRAHAEGDRAALERLAALVYPELKAMARRRAGGARMDATTLVNETFLKLLSSERIVAEDRKQFFGLMATIMRQLIVDEVRYLTAAKRGAPDVTFTESLAAANGGDEAEFLILVDRVLERLEGEDPKLARVFECRYFAGLTVAETAEALDLSQRSVERMWAAARERLADMLNDILD
ncbi:MAG: ECF-type sigma factor [Gammaproteobacteria bacterium]|nr:ECF-type sigma factor [Gammaproteobacteria bacterium]